MQHLPFDTSSATSWHSSHCPDGPPSIAAASYGGLRPSHHPDPDSVDAPTVSCHPRSLSGGFSSSSFAYEGTHYHNLVGAPPPHQVHGGMSVSLAVHQGFDPRIHSPMRHPPGELSIVPLGPDLYGGTQLPSARVPSVVYGGGLPQEPVHRAHPHVPASFGQNAFHLGSSVVSLQHDDICSSLASNVTMSLSVADQPAPPHLASTLPQTGPSPFGASLSSPVAPPATVPPSGLTAATAHDLPAVDKYDSDEDFCWAGDEDGLDYNGAGVNQLKSNARVAAYPTLTPSCNHSQVISSRSPALSSRGHTVNATSTSCISLPQLLMQTSWLLAKSSVGITSVGGLVVVDTGATDHMLPDKSAFISYKQVVGLSVRMGNNSFVPVLGRGTAIFSLNGKRLLIQNALHVPGLAVPLYSLRAHLQKCGCGFFGTYKAGFHVYFPAFILSVDTSSDCHLSYKSLGMSATLWTLQYVQPRCAATIYPSKTLASFSTATPSPTLIEDNGVTLVLDVSPHDDPSIVSLAPPLCPPSTKMDPPSPMPPSYLTAISQQLQSLAQAVQGMSPPPLAIAPPNSLPPT